MAKTTFYVQIEPTFSRYSWDSTKVQSIRAVKMTQSKPKTPKGGTVTVKLTLDIPEGVFLPLEPEAVITVPASMVQVNPIEVEATKPDEQSYVDGDTSAYGEH